MFSLEQLTSFVAVAEELHYGRAAERLSMTQPPLSRRIQLLERELGVSLFDRSRRNVKLTPSGRAFLADARRILALANEATLSAQRSSSGEAGTVAIGFTAAAAYSYLERVLAAVETALPDVELVLREMVTSSQVEALFSGAIDVGMVRPPVTGADIRTTRLLREPLLLAAPTSHRFAERDTDPHIAELGTESLVMYSPGQARYFYDVLAGVFRDAGIQPRYSQYVTQVHTIMALVKAGRGLGLVPAAAKALRFDGVTLRAVNGIAVNPVELDLAWRNGNDNPALDALLRVLSAGQHER